MEIYGVFRKGDKGLGNLNKHRAVPRRTRIPLHLEQKIRKPCRGPRCRGPRLSVSLLHDLCCLLSYLSRHWCANDKHDKQEDREDGTTSDRNKREISRSSRVTDLQKRRNYRIAIARIRKRSFELEDEI